ncbi:hypothetical protein R3P38DRAFT_2847420 [Favolaschia claudopus]|uniref:Uncharacterized protein n=1 Tax=Favolaschia claudopus TaxID=2862362 RepID=A0AAW0DRJ5_9AGAR
MVLFIAAAILPLLALFASASPYAPQDSLWRRTDDASGDPQFPQSPASCGVCSQHYDDIKLCLSVVPVVANFSFVISHLGNFTNVVTCGCDGTFNATFPQCVDCFQNTGQQAVLNMDDPQAVITGLEKVCALERSIGINNGAVANTVGLLGLVLVVILGNALW